jgi:thiamine biosynthesis lipoprotein ApbE
MSGTLARPYRAALADAPPAFTTWRALGMLIQLGVTDPQQLAAARDLLADDLDELDRSCSRFRPDSELVAVGAAAREASAPVTLAVSPLLAEAVAVSLRAARLTGGDVDPTVGAALAALGYDRDFSALAPADPPGLPPADTPAAHPALAAAIPPALLPPGTPAGDPALAAAVPPGFSPADPPVGDPALASVGLRGLSPADPPAGHPAIAAAGPPGLSPVSLPVGHCASGTAVVSVRVIPGWESIAVDTDASTLTLPPGVQLDLGATVKGWAADRSAARIAARLGGGVLVSLGGDTAVAGPSPDGGWRIRVQDTTGRPEDPPDGPSQVVAIRDGGLATSSTAARRWRHGGDLLHHILDPRTGLPAAPVWRTVSVAAATCADANTAATAAIIRGDQAPAWLASLNLPARLVTQDGSVRTVANWPTEPTSQLDEPMAGNP